MKQSGGGDRAGVRRQERVGHGEARQQRHGSRAGSTCRSAWRRRTRSARGRRCRRRRRPGCRRSGRSGPSRAGRASRRRGSAGGRRGTSAPPETSRIAPSIVPRPMMIATWPRMPPMPDSMTETASDFWTVPKSSVTERPARRPTAMETREQRHEGLEPDLDDQEEQQQRYRGRRRSAGRRCRRSGGAGRRCGVASRGRRRRAASGHGGRPLLRKCMGSFGAGGIAARRPVGDGRRAVATVTAVAGGRLGDGRRQPRTASASISMSRPGGQADVDRRAGGGGGLEALLLEVRVVDLVHLGEVVDVREVDADHHHVVPARAALLEDRLDVGEGLEGLLAQGRARRGWGPCPPRRAGSRPDRRPGGCCPSCTPWENFAGGVVWVAGVRAVFSVMRRFLQGVVCGGPELLRSTPG